MVTNVSAVNTAYVQDAIKYVNGIQVTNPSIMSDVKGAFGMVPSVGIINGTMFAGGHMFARTGQVSAKTGKAARAGIKGITSSLGNFKTVAANDTLVNLFKANKGLKGASQNYEIANLIKTITTDSKTGAQGVKTVENLIKNYGDDAGELLSKLQETAAAGAKVPKPSKLAKAGKWLLTKTGIDKAIANSATIQSVKGAASKFFTTNAAGKVISSGASKFSKAFKKSGAGVMLAIEGGMALFTEVIPAFKGGGFKEGMKQIGKSAVKVGASTAGWVGGAAAGQAIGSAIGGAIGTVFPVVGNVVGAAVGGFIGNLVGGAIGSAVAGKVAEKVVGEDYTDKVTNEQVEQQATMIAQNSASMSELNGYVSAMIQQDMADDGKLSDDSKKMLEYLQSGELAATGVTSSANYASTNSDLAQLIARVRSGDTSVYDVPTDVLNASANRSNLSFSGSYANNYTNFGYTNPYATSTNQTINYFG